MSTNETKGIYYATKVDADEELDPEIDLNETPVKPPTPDVEDKKRISELEKQLEELKKSLASLQPQNNLPPPPPSAFANLPPPPPSIAIKPRAVLSVPTKDAGLTPSFDSPSRVDVIPAPNFDHVETVVHESPSKEAPSTPVIPPPPPPPLKTITRSLTERQVFSMVPSGLHRTQSITDLIVSGKASKSVLRKIDVDRSPGGTPVKVTKEESFLAKALRHKFRCAHSSPKNSGNKENAQYSPNTASARKSSDCVVSDEEWD